MLYVRGDVTRSMEHFTHVCASPLGKTANIIFIPLAIDVGIVL